MFKGSEYMLGVVTTIIAVVFIRSYCEDKFDMIEERVTSSVTERVMKNMHLAKNARKIGF